MSSFRLSPLAFTAIFALLAHAALVGFFLDRGSHLTPVGFAEGSAERIVWMPPAARTSPARRKTVVSAAASSFESIEADPMSARHSEAMGSRSEAQAPQGQLDPYLARVFRQLLAQPIESPDTDPLDETVRVEIEFSVERDGRISEVSLAGGTQNTSLATAALSAVREVEQVDPVPDSLLRGRDSLRLKIPFEFETRP